MVNSKTKLPITVLTGFLGSGKTTLLNYILNHNNGIRFGVIVNDYGSINIDAQLVQKQTDTMLELSNGCICCSLETLDLQDAINQFIEPKPSVDYILIEASGLAESRELALNLANMISFAVRLDSIVCVLDAENIERNAKQHRTALEQIEFSDFVIVNKIDLVSLKKRRDIKKIISGINPKARIIETDHCQLDLRLILDQDVFLTNRQNTKDEQDHKLHAHNHFNTYSFSSSRPLHPLRFQEFVNSKLPLSVYRAKGFVDLGSKGYARKYIFQLVGTRAQITWDNWQQERPTTQLIFIGQGFDQDKLDRDLKACVDQHPNSTLKGVQVNLPQKAR